MPRLTARFETKPGSRSGGYERWRSYEFRAHTPGSGKEDVYLYHHRLLALLNFPLSMPISECLQEMSGSDVHHENGIKWDNRPDNLTLLDHGEHARLTNSAPSQAEQRAFAEDARGGLDEPGGDRCPRCDERADTLLSSPAYDGHLCPACSVDVQRAAAIE